MLSRFLALSLVSLTCSAQLPVVPVALKSAAPPTCFDYSSISSGTLFIWLSTCTNSVSFPNITPSAGQVGQWNDHTVNNNSFDLIHGFGGSVAPTYHSTGGSHGGEWVDFNHAGGSGNTLGCINAIATNQPITLFVVHTDTCTSSGNTLFDTKSGNRLWYRPITTGDIIASPTLITIAASKNSLKWMVRTMVFNGASSYVRTNGVLQSAGVVNPGSTGMGQICLGNDLSVTTPFRGGMEFILAYFGALNTNDLQTVENQLTAEARITP